MVVLVTKKYIYILVSLNLIGYQTVRRIRLTTCIDRIYVYGYPSMQDFNFLTFMNL